MADEQPKREMLQQLRDRIDRIDEELIQLLNRRAEVVVEIGRLKQTSGTAVYAPDREDEVLARVRELNSGPLGDRTVQAIWREMMSGSFALEKALRVAYLGPEGSFSHLAAMRKFGASVDYLPVTDIRTVFTEVRRGHVDLGIVPIENSVGGGVVDTLDAFVEAHVCVVAEVMVEIHHNLLANCAPEEITMIASKPEVFSQCRNWLSGRFHRVDLIPVASTSKAADMAAKQPHLGAIGSTLAAERYGLQVVFANIEDNPGNMTRFLVIGTKPTGPTGRDKTAVMFVTSHKPGALVEVLEVFRKYGINMTNIDTRPSKRASWEYTFFVDCEGHRNDESFSAALAEVKQHCLQLDVLGSFPAAREAI